MKYTLILFITIGISVSASAQSRYLNSLRNSLSFTGDVTVTNNTFYTGGGIGYTITGKNFIGVNYYQGSDRTDSQFNLDHQQIELAFQTSLLSQLKGDIYGVDAGIFASQSWFDNIDAFNRSLGINMIFSKKTIIGDRSMIVPHFELLYVPLSDTQVKVNGFDSGALLKEYFAGGLRSAYVYLPSSDKEIVLEAKLNYNFTDKNFSYGASLKIVL